MTENELVRISRALSDPARLQIYEKISSRGEMFCGQLTEQCALTPGTISHHLKILADAGLIQCRREGQFIYNRSQPRTIREYTRALKNIAKKKAASKS